MPDNQNKYFFRDIGHNANLEDGKSYHAAGIVLNRHDNNSASGKDLSVRFLHPFNLMVETEWRADSEVELFEAREFEWAKVSKLLGKQDN